MGNVNYNKRAQRIRSKLKQVNTERYRLTVFKSARNISAQIIDDKSNKTLVSESSIKQECQQKKNWFITYCCWKTKQESYGKENYKSVFR